MSDSGRLRGERVFCHQCSNEWDRAQGGLQCPNCESEFTEVLETPRSPPPEASHLSPIPPHHPFHDHDPWQDDIPDPEEDDIRTYQWNTNGGNGTLSFTSRTYVSGGGRMNGRNVHDDPAIQDLLQNLEGLLTHVGGLQNGRNNPPIPQVGGGMFPFMNQQPPGFGGFAAVGPDGILRPAGRDNGPAPQMASMQDLFGMLFASMNPPGGGRARGPNAPPDLGTLFAGIMNPVFGRAGDGVHSQEEFDRIMSQLMDQHQGSTAPPPASEAAINALPKTRVSKEMMGNDGKVECSICMDDVEIGTEVTILPCDHWFHDDCIRHWLKEHDTCPHCRKPISEHENQPSSPGSTRRHRGSASRESSSRSTPRAGPGEGSRRNPITVPDSPNAIREARQQFFSRRGEESIDQQRRRSSRSDSTQGGRPSGPRQASSSSNTGGGAMSWIRSHTPFGS